MPLPNFLCVGTIKGGTTTLHEILKHHPDVLLPSARKELRFFDVDENYRRGLDYYASFFAEHKGQSAIGEIAPTYAYRGDVAERIAKALGPDVRLIFSLRNPVDRAYSHYLMNCMKQYESRSFSDALALEVDRLRGGITERARFSYFDQSRYAAQIRRFLDYFPRESMLFLTFEEDLLERRAAALEQIYTLLNIPPADIDLNVWSYAGETASIQKFPALRGLGRFRLVRRAGQTRPAQAVKRLLKKPVPKKLDEGTRRELIERHFVQEIRDLERLIGRDLQRWIPKD
jgi:Sulfotransferase domain